MSKWASAKLVSLFLVAAILMLGYTSMSAWATLIPTDGQIAIDHSSRIFQSSNVEVFFMGGEDFYGSSLRVSSLGTRINGGTEIGVQSPVTCNLNLTTWNPVSVNNAGIVATFSLWSTGNWVPFTFNIGSLNNGVWFNVYIDGGLGPERLVSSDNAISFSFAGSPGTHQFEIRQLAMTAANVGLITALFTFLYLGVLMVPLNLFRKVVKTRKMPTIHDTIRTVVTVIIALPLISVAWLLVG